MTEAGPLSPAQREQILRLTGAATAADGVAPLSEQAMLHVRHGGAAAGGDAGEPGPAGVDLLAGTDGTITGYAQLEWEEPGVASAELVVDPAHRRQGTGRALLTGLAEQAGDATLRVWAHGDLPAAAELARAAGLSRVRALFQLSRPLSGARSEPLPEPVWPDGVTLRTFAPGRDEESWLRLNALAFAHHPEQGAWTRIDLDLREQEDWFDPAGFFLAERNGRLAGFHWTKVHSEQTGEVYVVGVDPAEQGSGLGRALTLTGLRYLRDDRGLAEVMLYVDETNQAAVRMYRSLGFTLAATDVMYGTG
ncbi:MAG TPA: mycothiol synthase [Streptosporangiaceae bacterium]|nr:mycothiol synthase [Streptosporangiaceae bacterium]